MPGPHRLLDPGPQYASAGRSVARQIWPIHRPHLKYLCFTKQPRFGILHWRDQLSQVYPDHSAAAPSASVLQSPDRTFSQDLSSSICMVSSTALFRQVSRSYTSISSRGVRLSGWKPLSQWSGSSKKRLPRAAAKSYTVLSSSGHEHQNHQHKGIGRSAPPRHAGFGSLASGRPAGFQKMQRPAKAASKHEGHENDMGPRHKWNEKKILWVGSRSWRMPFKPKQHCTITCQIDDVVG